MFVNYFWQQCVIDVRDALWHLAGSEGHEKYVRELSVTPVEYFMGAIKNRSCGVSIWGLFCMAEMWYFKPTGMIFPRLALRY
jgi:hypothetical protein